VKTVTPAHFSVTPANYSVTPALSRGPLLNQSSGLRVKPAMTMLLLFAVLTCSVHADYQEGLDAYQKGDYDKALGEWLEVTRSPPEQVHPGVLAETYYAIAMLFWIGQGVPQDTSIAARWLQQAAEMHHAGAQTKLGYLCSSGQGVPQSDFEAFKWFQMAAWQGDADAQYNLGVLYREGLGVEVNQAKALEWFREAASNGDAESSQIVAQYEPGGPAPEPIPEPTTVATTEATTEVNAEPFYDPIPQALVDVPETTPPEGAAVPSTDLPLDSGTLPQGEMPEAAPALEAEVVASELANETAVEEFASDPPEGGMQQAAWILDRDPEHYTIQVIAVRDHAKLRDFADTHPDWAPWAIYEQSLKGQPLWVLLQGDYTDVELARAAAMKFPTDIQKHDQLWVRRYAMVQDLLP
jgi:TPR repeat protein